MLRIRTALAAATIVVSSLAALAAPAHATSASSTSASSASGTATTGTATSAAAAPTYVVKRGDNLRGIAIKLKVRLADLLATNKLVPTSLIQPGQVLTVPVSAISTAQTTATTGAPKATTANSPYLVQSGDFLLGIAKQHGVTLGALLKANGLTLTSTIHAGRTLQIPPATLPVTAALPKADIAPSTSTTSTTNPTNSTSSTSSTSTTVLSTDSTVGGATSSAHDQAIATLLTYLQAQVGKPYVFNTAGPESFDCSGLVVAAYSQIGITLPHQSLMLSTHGTAVDWTTEPIMAGDLILMYSSAHPGVISHVGVAMSATTWIQAARTGVPVYIGAIPVDKIQAVRRIVQP